MFKMPILIAVFVPSVAFAAMPVLTAGTQTPPPEQSQSAHGARVSDQLSMGPDPGGKTSATVSPTTTKTGQPSADGTGASKGTGASNGTAASNQSGATSTAAPAVARDTTDPKTAPAGGSATSKE